MKNTLGDLNNHLFAQLERLGDEDIKGEELKEEIERSKAVKDIAKGITETASVVLAGQKFMAGDRMNADAKLPRMLEGGKE